MKQFILIVIGPMEHGLQILELISLVMGRSADLPFNTIFLISMGAEIH